MTNTADEIKNEIIILFNSLKIMNLILLILLILVILLIVIFFILHKLKFKQFIFFISLVTILLVFASISFSNFLLDDNYVKNDNFCTIQLKVIGYTRGHSDENGEYERGNPIFEDENGKRYYFVCGPTDIDHIYIIMYLPNTKLASILEEVE